MRRFSTVWALFFLLGFATCGQARPMWQVPPISAFDGRGWGEMRLGQTTFRQIQGRFATGKGFYTDSTELTLPKKSAFRIDLLWDRSGGGGRLQAITVYFEGYGPRREAVEKLFSARETAAEFYRPGRYQTWRVAKFASRGAALFTINEGEQETMPLLLMTTPVALNATTLLCGERVPVQPYVDPHANQPKIASFGDIQVSFSGDGALELPGGEKSRAREDIQVAQASGALYFDASSTGTYHVSASSNDRAHKGGSVTASVCIQGYGPYGWITARGSQCETWSWSSREVECRAYCDADQLCGRLSGAYRDAVGAARAEAEGSFARQMAASGPPTTGQLLWGQWSEVLSDVREKTQLAPPIEAVYAGILR